MEYQCKNVMFLLFEKKRKHFHTQSNQSLQSEMLVISFWVENREFKNTLHPVHIWYHAFLQHTRILFFSMNSFTCGSDEFSDVMQTMRT